MKIAILSIYPFPFGMAATNRIAAYSQGLVENGVDVDVISILPPEPPYIGNEPLPDTGEYNGVRYFHPSGRYRNKSKILRALSMKTGIRFWRGVYKTRKLLRRNRYDAVILSFDEPKYIKTYTGIAKKYGAKVLFIFDEYPTPIRHELKSDIPQWKKDAYRKVLQHVDGYISISGELVDYYNAFVKHPSCLLPVIVNVDKFTPRHVQRENHISYVGNMELSKDNVDNIIRAFALISKRYPDYSLHFYGQPVESTLSKLKILTEELSVNQPVIFEGRIDSEKVPEIISLSKVMVSSQPDTLRAKGGFPTKLGEYIASGTPTLLCDVGENRRYITDNDCYYALPENPEDYAEQLDYILSHYDEALAKATHGRKTIVDKYSHTAAGRKIKEFILKTQ